MNFGKGAWDLTCKFCLKLATDLKKYTGCLLEAAFEKAFTVSFEFFALGLHRGVSSLILCFLFWGRSRAFCWYTRPGVVYIIIFCIAVQKQRRFRILSQVIFLSSMSTGMCVACSFIPKFCSPHSKIISDNTSFAKAEFDKLFWRITKIHVRVDKSI